MLSSDFHCKENDGTARAAHLFQTFLTISPDIRRVRSLANHRSLGTARSHIESKELSDPKESSFSQKKLNQVRFSSRSVIFFTMKIRREY